MTDSAGYREDRRAVLSDGDRLALHERTGRVAGHRSHGGVSLDGFESGEVQGHRALLLAVVDVHHGGSGVGDGGRAVQVVHR